MYFTNCYDWQHFLMFIALGLCIPTEEVSLEMVLKTL